MPYVDVELLTKYGAYVLASVLAGRPCNWLVRKIIKRWNPYENASEDKIGALIGTLERILMIVLVGLESYAAVGFVVTMKSITFSFRVSLRQQDRQSVPDVEPIARYDRVQKEKAFAEYFLAGTMLSMLIALILGLIVQRSFGKL